MTREEFLFLRRMEIPKTIRLLEMFPEEKHDLRPAEKTRTALELATVFVTEERACERLATGQPLIPAPPQQQRPQSIAAAIEILRESLETVNTRVATLTEEEFHKPVEFFGRTVPLVAGMLAMLLDHIHHRGQFTIYARLAGGKVPQIYGPSADEPINL